MIFLIDESEFDNRKATVPAFLVTLHKPLRPNKNEKWPPPQRDLELMFSVKRLSDEEREKYRDVTKYNLILSFPSPMMREFWLVFDLSQPYAGWPRVIARVQDDVNDTLRGECRPMTNTFRGGLFVQAFSAN